MSGDPQNGGTPIQGVPLAASQPFQTTPGPVAAPIVTAQVPTRPTRESVPLQRVVVPIAWVVAIVLFVAGGAGVFYRLEAHISDKEAHVSRHDLRTVLRAMTIDCKAAPAGGLSCTVDLPREAD